MGQCFWDWQMRFPPAPMSLRGIHVQTSGIEPGGHRWVKNPTKALLGGLEMPSERGSVWQFLFLPGNLLPRQLKEVLSRGWSWGRTPRICLYGFVMPRHPGIFASVPEQVVLDEFLLGCLGLKGLSWKGLEDWDWFSFLSKHWIMLEEAGRAGNVHPGEGSRDT